METKELIERMNTEYSFAEFYKLKSEIIEHLTELIKLKEPTIVSYDPSIGGGD